MQVMEGLQECGIIGKVANGKVITGQPVCLAGVICAGDKA